MLRRFSEGQNNTLDAMQRAAAQRNQADFVALAHAFKGVAANLGAVEMAADAALLEKMAVSQDWAVVEQVLARVRQSFAIAGTAIDTLAPVSPPQTAPPASPAAQGVDLSPLLPHLEALRGLLERNDFSAFQRFDEIRREYPELMAGDFELQGLAALIGRFEFDAAAAAVVRFVTRNQQK